MSLLLDMRAFPWWLDNDPRLSRRAGSLPGKHRVPFDGMMIAQSLARDLEIVSIKVLVDGFGARRLW